VTRPGPLGQEGSVRVGSTLEIERDGAVRVVRMTRPEHRNAINRELHRELAEVWSRLAVDPDVKAVVLCGAGGFFSAGGDADWLYELATDQLERARTFEEAKHLVSAMLRFPMPIVAALDGAAVGLGSSMVSLCDLVIMGENAFIADPHVALGVVAGDGAVATGTTSTGNRRRLARTIEQPNDCLLNLP
jgi:enoyl-CoA hydratase/carnithine racemase